MIALHASVLARYLLQDDSVASQKATDIVEALSDVAPAFVAREAVAELVRRLERDHGIDRGRVAQTITRLLQAPELLIEDAELIGLAADRYGGGTGRFADHVTAAVSERAGARQLLTLESGSEATDGRGTVK